ncbi:MAG: hypothetical protein JWM16_1251 [Verrucomicrobiales bacterium]|nr:hypothetical protein [Verrucomicrobiales bacterium]
MGFLAALPTVLAVAILVALTIFLGEIMSNAATAALLIPIAAPVAVINPPFFHVRNLDNSAMKHHDPIEQTLAHDADERSASPKGL